jgi:chromatin assembly factor 1 subunit A
MRSILGPAKSTDKDNRSEYERTFLPFNIPSHTKLAPINYFLNRDQNLHLHLEDLNSQLDLDLASDQRTSVKEVFGPPVPRGHPVVQVKEIMDLLQGISDSYPAESSMAVFKTNQEQAMDQLKDTQMKYLHFHEDVRPPYFGTYTKPLMPQEWRKLCRNPCSFKMNMYDYEYDSEAEWEDDVEDGEDVMSNGEDEDEEDGDEDMEDFLDDEGLPAGQVPKRYAAGELNPRCSGLHWQDEGGKLQPADPSSQPVDFAELQMGFLLGKLQKLAA